MDRRVFIIGTSIGVLAIAIGAFAQPQQIVTA